MATSDPEPAPSALFGREQECAEIDRLLDDALGGRGSSLVVRGPPGIGKTALLGYAEHRLPVLGAEHRRPGTTALWTSGLETESDLAFAGLFGLLRPIQDNLAEIPGRQADALAGALGLSVSTGSDRFVVSAAVLSLLAAAAETRPLICLIDDVQWLDSASADALLFVARRLGAERIAMLFASRDGAGRAFPAPGLVEITLAGLPMAAATALVGISAPAASASTRSWLLAQASGNPLALLELPSVLSEAQLEGRAVLPAQVKLSSRLQAAFAQRTRDLAPTTRDALLIAAVADSADAGIVLRAAAVAGAPDDALDEAERAGLMSIADGGRIVFRHPLVRAALTGAATTSERRRAHAALAAVLDDDRLVWHLALASLGRDEQAAAALEASARRSQARSAHSSAIAAFERAAELSVDASRRRARLAGAAHAAWAAGQPDRAVALIAQALPLAAGPLRAELLHLQGIIETRTGDVRASIGILLDAFEASSDPSLRLALLMEAAEAATYAGDYAQAMALGARADTIEPRSEIDRFHLDALGGLSATLGGEHERASALLTSAIRRADRLDDPGSLIWAARLATLAGAHGDLAGSRDGLPQARRAVALARERALLSLLPVALQEQSTALVGHARFTLAYAAAEEGIGLARDFGQRWGPSWSLANLASIDAVRGDQERARAHADQTLELALTSGAAFIAGFARRALALLDLTLGRPGDATERLLALTTPGLSESNPVIALWSTPDLIEAAARSGRLADVDQQLQHYAAWADRGPSPQRRSLLARCRALAADRDHQAHFEAALSDASSLSPFQQGRTELLYGEWLRRERERREARAHLRKAAELFRQIAVRPWEQRAQAELRATGETSRARDPAALDALTPQELQITGLVASGMTNRQVAAQLYLSPRTIDYHLSKVFSKLGLASRTELVRMGVPVTGVEDW